MSTVQPDVMAPTATRTTQAVVIPAPGQVVMQSVQLRPLGSEEVAIQTAYTSVSAGTERMLLAGQMPHPMLQLPVIPGYETVGRVVEVGGQVDPTWLGRWVYVGGVHCYQGVNPAWGGQAALLFAPVSRIVPLDGVAPQHGVLLALAATALHGVDLLQVGPDQRVLVLGQGPVGQLAARFARSLGATVVVVDRTPARLARAVADTIVDVSETPLTDQVKGPFDAIIEATGRLPVLTEALRLLADKGAILLLGYYQKLDLPYMPLFLKEARLLTSKEWGAGDLVRCRDQIAAGTLDVAPLLTHVFPIAQVVEGYGVALDDPACLKLVFDWTAGVG